MAWLTHPSLPSICPCTHAHTFLYAWLCPSLPLSLTEGLSVGGKGRNERTNERRTALVKEKSEPAFVCLFKRFSSLSRIWKRERKQGTERTGRKKVNKEEGAEQTVFSSRLRAPLLSYPSLVLFCFVVARLPLFTASPPSDLCIVANEPLHEKMNVKMKSWRRSKGQRKANCKERAQAGSGNEALQETNGSSIPESLGEGRGAKLNCNSSRWTAALFPPLSIRSSCQRR
mmetsp:Transcript_17013/g.34521  ORF Transcript_17013/g.34521 Transcript_17013/m.34521 type:complete len:229 (-) Transcript_17013:452-1138(-)